MVGCVDIVYDTHTYIWIYDHYMHNVNISVCLSMCKVSHEVNKGLRKIHEILTNIETMLLFRSF